MIDEIFYMCVSVIYCIYVCVYGHLIFVCIVMYCGYVSVIFFIQCMYVCMYVSAFLIYYYTTLEVSSLSNCFTWVAKYLCTLQCIKSLQFVQKFEFCEREVCVNFCDMNSITGWIQGKGVWSTTSLMFNIYMWLQDGFIIHGALNLE